MTPMVWKLLKHNISKPQIAGYVLANLVGLIIVITAVRIYGDVSTAWQDEDSFVSRDYMVLTRRVSSLNTLGVAAKPEFDNDDLEDLRQQPWVRKADPFRSADFTVMARMGLGGKTMSTYLFFESIPDDYLDIEPSRWKFQAPPVDAAPDQIAAIDIPIIMSKDYLSLYNFGFAATRGLPQLSEAVVGSVPVTIELGGNGRYDTYRAHIVGFSSRLNTIAVPDGFLRWANERYSVENHGQNPSRVIVEANTPGDPAIQKYLDKNGYEVAGDKADNARANYFLRVITAIVVSVGGVISLLAFFILMLSIYLLLQKNRRKLHELMLLGYTPGQAGGPYTRLVLWVNGSVLVLAVAAMLWLCSLWEPSFKEMGIGSTSPLTAILTGAGIMTVITIVNLLAIRRIVRRNFYDS